MLLTSIFFDDLGIMFGFILMVYGAYSIHTANEMKKTGNPPQWLVAEREMNRIHNPREFCEALRPKTMLFGVVCILYGAYSMVESMFIQKDVAEAAGVTVFVVFLIWFIITLQNTKGKYIH